MGVPVALSVQSDGVALNVWDYGGDGPPLVLAHCTGTHGRIWDPLVPELSRRFHVYAPDMRGHGDSSKPSDPDAYCASLLGEDLIAVVEFLGAEGKVFAAGHSAGAASVGYAALERPDIVAAAVLIDPIIMPAEFNEGPNSLADTARRRRTTFAEVAEARARYASKPPMNTWVPEALDAYVEHAFAKREDGQVELKCTGRIEADMYERGGAPDLFEALGRLTPPVRIVTGEQSHIRSFAELQHEQLPSADYRLVRDVGHFLPQERPSEISALILDWL